uniref:NADH dehydrogenase subunit 4L n=1 Tax=Austromenopon paululum TaxID=2965261 RepID=UPI0026E487C1|nr:NADH dehydrogenase subunit 4L [Austromenopon paululum]WJJ69871.1 NADH dehydrogenase subunit 4L [Austromenopon paululum]
MMSPSFLLAIILVSCLVKVLSEKSMLVIMMTMEMLMLTVLGLVMLSPQYLWFSSSPALVWFISLLVCESVMALGIYVGLARWSQGAGFPSPGLLSY